MARISTFQRVRKRLERDSNGLRSAKRSDLFSKVCTVVKKVLLGGGPMRSPNAMQKRKTSPARAERFLHLLKTFRSGGKVQTKK